MTFTNTLTDAASDRPVNTLTHRLILGSPADWTNGDMQVLLYLAAHQTPRLNEDGTILKRVGSSSTLETLCSSLAPHMTSARDLLIDSGRPDRKYDNIRRLRGGIVDGWAYATEDGTIVPLIGAYDGKGRHLGPEDKVAGKTGYSAFYTLPVGPERGVALRVVDEARARHRAAVQRGVAIETPTLEVIGGLVEASFAAGSMHRTAVPTDIPNAPHGAAPKYYQEEELEVSAASASSTNTAPEKKKTENCEAVDRAAVKTVEPKAPAPRVAAPRRERRRPERDKHPPRDPAGG